MVRFIVVSLVYFILLGISSIDVTFKDGLHIKYRGWPELLRKRSKK